MARLAVVLTLATASCAAPTAPARPVERVVATPLSRATPEVSHEAVTPPLPAPVVRDALPTPGTMTAPAPSGEAPGNLLALIAVTFPEDAARAVAIAHCESGGFDPAVVYGPRTGSAGERGVLQIHPVHRDRIRRMGLTWDAMFEPAANLRVARALYDESGWQPWTCA